MPVRPATITAIISAGAVVVCFYRAARAYDRVVGRLQASHPDMWELAGKPRPMLALLPGVLSDRPARRALMSQLTGRLPDWIGSDAIALDYVRRFRDAYRDFWFAFVLSVLLSLVAVGSS